MEKAWISGEPSQERPAYQNFTKSASTTHPGEPRRTSKELQASLASVEFSVHNSAIRKTLSKSGIDGRVARRKPRLTKKNAKARLSFAEKHLEETSGVIFCGLMSQRWFFLEDLGAVTSG